MWKQFIFFIFCFGMVLFATPLIAAATEWSVTANYAESCSCSPSCPCVFGSAPTLGHCNGTSMVAIKKGHYGDVKLDGITVVSAFGTGKWVKHYVSDNATDSQIDAIGKLMPSVFGYHRSAEVLAISKASVTVERTNASLKYAAPDTLVHIEAIKGADGGPIVLTNIPVESFPGPAILEAKQYKSITLSHNGQDKKFTYSGTNGYVGRIETKGTSEM